MPTTPFLDLFGKSPVRPLEEHMAKVHACVKELCPFIDAVIAQDWEKADQVRDEIAKLENDADDLKRELRLHLPNSLFMPFSRGDLLLLLEVQDALANKAKDISGIILGRKMQFPDAIADQYLEFLNKSVKASEKANLAIQELDELLETGFGGNEMKLVESMIEKLVAIEHSADNLEIKIRQQMLDLEKSLPPIDVMFIYKVIHWTGNLADDARQIGDHLQILLAK